MRVLPKIKSLLLERRPFSSIPNRFQLYRPHPTVTSPFENKENVTVFINWLDNTERLQWCKAMQQMTVDELSQIRLRIVGKFRVEDAYYRSDVHSAIQDLQSVS